MAGYEMPAGYDNWKTATPKAWEGEATVTADDLEGDDRACYEMLMAAFLADNHGQRPTVSDEEEMVEAAQALVADGWREEGYVYEDTPEPTEVGEELTCMGEALVATALTVKYSGKTMLMWLPKKEG